MACKDQADIKKALQHSSDKDGKATAAYFKTRAESGDCLQLTRGQLVDVDERDGPLWCVRPSGGLDCFWTLEKAVDLYPSKASVPASSNSSLEEGASLASRTRLPIDNRMLSSSV